MRAIATALLVAFLQGAAPAPQTRTAMVSGQVLDATSSKPVAGVTVVLAMGAPPGINGANQNQLMPRSQDRRGIALTNTQGRFVFRDVPAGDFSLIATAEGYAPGASGRHRIGGPGSTFVVKDGARITDANVRIWRHAAVSGIVRDDRGEPVIGVPIWAMKRSLTGGQLSLSLEGGGALTDDRGMYRISNLLPGSYIIAIRLVTLSVPVALSDAWSAAAASGGGGALGSIMRGGSTTGALGIEGGGIRIDDFQVRVSSGQPPVLPGPGNTLLVHRSVFHPTASAPADATAIELTAGDDRSGIDFRLPLVAGVRVSGVLTGPDGPLVNAGIRLVPAPTNEIAFDIPAAYSTTDANGRFAFLGVTTGSYVIHAYRVSATGARGRPVPPPAPGALANPESGAAPPSAIFGDLPVTVGSSNVDGLSVVMQPGAQLIGRVTFDGTPPVPAQIQRIQLYVRPINGTQPDVTVQIDGEGRLTSTGIAPGRYMLTPGSMPAANTPGVLWALTSAQIGRVDGAREAFTVGANDINDVVLTFSEKSIALAGTVRTADGASGAEATVVAFPADTQAWIASGMSTRCVVTTGANASGAYDLRLRLPGEYLVVAIPPEIAPDVDPAFVKKFSTSAVRMSFALGDTKSQPLTMARAR